MSFRYTSRFYFLNSLFCEYFLDFFAFLLRILINMIEYTADFSLFFFGFMVLYRNASEKWKYFIFVCSYVRRLNKNIENLLKKAMILRSSMFFIFS